MSKFFSRLGTSYHAGIEILNIVQREAERGSPAHKLKMRTIATEIQEGRTLAQAMKASDYFPELALAVVEAGELGGRLEEAFQKLSQHYGDLVKFRNNFLMSLAWPAFELFASVAIIGLLILALGWIAASNNSKPALSLGTGSTAGDFSLYCVLVTLFFGSIALTIVGTMKGWFGLYPMRIARRIPLIGKTIEAMSLSRFAWTMSVAENAGMGAVNTLRLATRSTQNYFYTNHEKPMCKDVQNGLGFYPTLNKTNLFPEEFLTYVENGEIAGQLAESMERASKDLQQRTETNMKLIGTIGFVMMMVFVGIVIAVTIISLFMKLYYEPLQDMIDNPMGLLMLLT
ncbi:type II secretion system F family protein [bacterium]|nr:type II secretion system F family protein [bacterium]